ncbi:MAG: NADPH-dependent F420 reductase [Dehalococcoidia bacterium]
MTRIGFIGGTGPEGKGLAYRFALAGHEVIIGSRSAERGEEAAREIAERVPAATVRGAANLDAAREAELVVLTVPFAAQADTLPPLAESVAGKAVVSSGVPLSFDGGKPSMAAVPEGSAAQQAQALLPGARVAGAFQNLAAAKLWDGDNALDQDVVVCADDADAKRDVMALAESIRGARAVDGGPLANARYVEGITVMLISINRRYKTTAGVRIVGV